MLSKGSNAQFRTLDALTLLELYLRTSKGDSSQASLTPGRVTVKVACSAWAGPLPLPFSSSPILGNLDSCFPISLFQPRAPITARCVTFLESMVPGKSKEMAGQRYGDKVLPQGESCPGSGSAGPKKKKKKKKKLKVYWRKRWGRKKALASFPAHALGAFCPAKGPGRQVKSGRKSSSGCCCTCLGLNKRKSFSLSSRSFLASWDTSFFSLCSIPFCFNCLLRSVVPQFVSNSFLL